MVLSVNSEPSLAIGGLPESSPQLTSRGPWDWDGHTVQVEKKGRSSAYEELFILVTSRSHYSPNYTRVCSPQHLYRYSTAISHTRTVPSTRSLGPQAIHPSRTAHRTRNLNPFQYTRTAADQTRSMSVLVVENRKERHRSPEQVKGQDIPQIHEPRTLLHSIASLITLLDADPAMTVRCIPIFSLTSH